MTKSIIFTGILRQVRDAMTVFSVLIEDTDKDDIAVNVSTEIHVLATVNAGTHFQFGINYGDDNDGIT